MPRKLILYPGGFYCEAAAGSAEEAFADKAQQPSGSETCEAPVCQMKNKNKDVGVEQNSQRDTDGTHELTLAH